MTRPALLPAHDWSAQGRELTVAAGPVLLPLAGVRLEDSRAATAPLVRALEVRGITPRSFAEMSARRRADEVFGAALQARLTMADALAENALAADTLPAGDAELLSAVASLHLLSGPYAPYLDAAGRETARLSLDVGRGKLSEQQSASILALARRMARALGSSTEEAAAAAAAAEAHPDSRGFYAPSNAPPRDGSEFTPPKPNRVVMAASSPMARWLLRGVFHVRGVNIPPQDDARLCAATGPNRATFLAPSHPEFLTDLLIDKFLAARYSPRAASWADFSFMKKIIPWFWSSNTLVSNDGGRAAMAWTRAWVLEGRSALIHPEGMVNWTSVRVHPLFRGLAEMALATADNAMGRPVYIAPLVWKLVFQTDVSQALHAEMSSIEKALGLASTKSYRGPLEMRFFHLQEAILRRQMRRFGYSEGREEPDFFWRQEAFRSWLLADLRARYPVAEAETETGTQFRLIKALRANTAATTGDRERLNESKRLGSFLHRDYNTHTLTQEQIFESLRRIRMHLMKRGWRDEFPGPLGPRVAHVRAAEPILVRPAEGTAARDALLARVHRALQERLDRLHEELKPQTERFARPNPFHVPAP